MEGKEFILHSLFFILYSIKMPVRNKKNAGFTLIEIIVAIGVFSLFSMGIYSSIQFIFKVVYQSRIKVVESGIANEHIEIIRNIPFENIGLIQGVPSGVLTPTVTMTRNGQTFLITRTVRNIDDPFDGTIGGSPNDTAPADVKLVEVSVLCTSCNQQVPVVLTTHISPKYLEGDATKGTLFVRVLNASGIAVPGATVHVTATFPTSSVDITDVTNNSGLLALIDLLPGINKYNISVSKSGYTSDQTVVSSVSNPNPNKPPVSVIVKSVSEISFTIDQVASMELSTTDSSCSVIGNAAVTISGAKLLGTDPDVLAVNGSVTTNGSGVYSFINYGWDAYNFVPSLYDVIGAIPMLPITLQPGAAQPVQLLLGANTAHSLLVGARDSITLQPISNALVHVTASGYDQTKTTGVGHIRQTDWSGGAGQSSMSDDTRYATDDGKISISSPSGSITLKKVGQNYYTNGFLESSTFDLGLSANYISLTWEPVAQPAQTGDDPVRFQIATAASSTPSSWEYLGPDGTSSTYYLATTPAIHEVHDGSQYVRYKVYLRTDSTEYTPTVSDMTISYTNSCTPPGQSYFSSLANQEYVVEVSNAGYQTNTSNVTVSGDTRLIIDLTEN